MSKTVENYRPLTEEENLIIKKNKAQHAKSVNKREHGFTKQQFRCTDMHEDGHSLRATRKYHINYISQRSFNHFVFIDKKGILRIETLTPEQMKKVKGNGEFFGYTDETHVYTVARIMFDVSIGGATGTRKFLREKGSGTALFKIKAYLSNPMYGDLHFGLTANTNKICDQRRALDILNSPATALTLNDRFRNVAEVANGLGRRDVLNEVEEYTVEFI